MKHKRKPPKKNTILRTLLRYAARQKAGFVWILISAVLASSIEIAAPFLVGSAIDRLAGPGQVEFQAVLGYLILLAVLYILFSLFTYIANFLSYRSAQRMVREIRSDTYDRLAKLPLRHYDTHPHGDTISRFVNDATTIADGLVEGITQLFTGSVTIVGTLVFMLRISLPVTAVVIGVTSLTFVVANRITKFSNLHFKNQQAITGELGGLVEELVGGLRTVKAFSYENTAAERFEEINSRLYTAGQKAQFGGSLTNPTTRFVNYLAYIAIGVVGGVLGGLSAGRISSFIIYSNQFARPFNQLTAIVTQIMAAWAAAGRVFELMYTAPEIPDAPDAAVLAHSDGHVAFDRIYFSYHPPRPLIEDFTLSVTPGQRVAVVGPTGAGKTTLVNLIMRFYDVNDGAVLVDHTDIRRITRESLRRNIGMVLQETWLFEGTVAENIAYAKPGASEEEIISAAKSAHAHSFIKRLPDGYNTLLDEGGGSLSAGQRQLLTIARAMLAKPDILVLDEATSSIDTLTEQRITKAFAKMMQGTTSFIIAHRLSTIRDADLIIVMNEGHIVEQGNHEALLAAGGFYAKLYNSQFAGVS